LYSFLFHSQCDVADIQQLLLLYSNTQSRDQLSTTMPCCWSTSIWSLWDATHSPALTNWLVPSFTKSWLLPQKKNTRIELEGKITTVSRVASRQEFNTIHRAKNQKTPGSSAKKNLYLLLLWRFVTTNQQKFKSNNLSELKSERFFLVLVLLKLFSSGNKICSNNHTHTHTHTGRV